MDRLLQPGNLIHGPAHDLLLHRLAALRFVLQAFVQLRDVIVHILLQDFLGICARTALSRNLLAERSRLLVESFE